jgi:hypothetical protein
MGGSRFFEFVLVVDQPTLTARLEHRAAHPDRPEHVVNARLVSVSDVPDLVASTDRLLAQRPSAWPVDASGTPAETVHLMRERLTAPSAVRTGSGSTTAARIRRPAISMAPVSPTLGIGAVPRSPPRFRGTLARWGADNGNRNY